MIDLESGNLHPHVKNTITSKTHDETIGNLFEAIVKKRNRIVHSVQITNDGEQCLLAIEKGTHKQTVITEGFLMDFIKLNEQLSDLLHDYRGY